MVKKFMTQAGLKYAMEESLYVEILKKDDKFVNVKCFWDF